MWRLCHLVVSTIRWSASGVRIDLASNDELDINGLPTTSGTDCSSVPGVGAATCQAGKCVGASPNFSPEERGILTSSLLLLAWPQTPQRTMRSGLMLPRPASTRPDKYLARVPPPPPPQYF